MVYWKIENGIAERINKTLIEIVRFRMTYADLPLSFWEEVVYTTSYFLIGKVDTF